mgnify:CR=1 FL=1
MTIDEATGEIRRTDFLDLLAASPEMSLAVIKWMSSMLRDTTATIRNLAIASPDRRIAEVLVKHSTRVKPGT